jgi:preprotein translocase subunit Sss1
MKPFKLFIERKIRNPLRKEGLVSSGQFDFHDPRFLDQYREYYRKYPVEQMDDPEDQVIRRKYENLFKSSEELAERYLESEVQKVLAKMLRPTTKEYKKVYEYQGVQVFVDEDNVDDTNFSPGSYNYRMVKHNVLVMLVYIRDILPNRKPKVVITNLSKNPYTKSAFDANNPSAGMAYSKHIYLDESYFDDSVYWVHEYAHWVADLIPTQTQEMLRKAYKKMLNLYYKKMGLSKTKEKKTPPNEVQLAKMAAKLGFPEYGLTNHDEFFAVLIENWKQLPNNKLTYKFKSLVKSILTRL